MNRWIRIYFIMGFILISSLVTAQQRFPKPEFHTDYTQPSPTTPEPRSLTLEYFDILVLITILVTASWFILRSRSRRGILWLSVFTLIYFGFYRKGCICPIGAIQNVAFSFSDPNYTISWIVMAFFLAPLIFTLFFGRTFCAAGCPLGAIQDLVVIKPVSLPLWLRQILGIIPYIYLGLAVLYAVTGTDFIICRYDPFIGIFRMDAPFHMVVLGISFLLMGMFVARSYCRFLCPYGVLLNWMSRFSKWHLTITPSECIRCKLCADSCPFDAIESPGEEKSVASQGTKVQQFILYFLLIPVWILAGAYSVSRSSDFLARANQDVYLAELLISHPELKDDPDNIDIQVFLASGKSMENQIDDALIIRKKFRTGSWFLGGFLGLVIGVKLMNQLIFRKRKDYEPNRGDCYSCGRCMDYCPVK